MPNVTNNTVRPIRIGTTLLVPGQTGNVPDEHMENARLKQLMEGGSLATETTPPPVEPDPAKKQAPQPENRPQPQQGGNQQTRGQPSPVDQNKQQEVRKN
jgi:hypothetical protein